MLNPLHILKHSSKLTIAGMIGTALNFPISIVIANKLGPTLFGQVSFVLLWLTYAGLLRTGIFEGGQREIIHSLGQERLDQARFYQNLSLSGELLSALAPATVLFCAAFFFPDSIRRVGFILAPLSFIGASLSRMLGGYHFAHQRFGVYARFNLIRSLAQPLLLLAMFFVIGPYALFVVPAIVEWGICILYLCFAPALGIEWRFEKKEALRLIRIGLPLGLQALVYWGYRLTGLTSVAVWLPAQQLGYYAFSAKLIDFGIRPFSDFGSVLMPSLWAEMGRSGNARDLSRDATRICLLVTVATCAVCNLFQAGFAPVVQLVTPRYTSSVGIFEVLSFNVILLTIISVPSLILDSVVVNKQWLHLNIWVGGLIINLGANYFVLRKGWGLLAIAWNDIWVQVLAILFIYGFAHRYLFHDREGAWRFYGSALALLSVSGLVFVLLRWSPLSFTTARGIPGLIAALGARCLIVAAVWSCLCIPLYLRNRQSSSTSIVEPTA